MHVWAWVSVGLVPLGAVPFQIWCLFSGRNILFPKMVSLKYDDLWKCTRYKKCRYFSFFVFQLNSSDFISSHDFLCLFIFGIYMPKINTCKYKTTKKKKDLLYIKCVIISDLHPVRSRESKNCLQCHCNEWRKGMS